MVRKTSRDSHGRKIRPRKRTKKSASCRKGRWKGRELVREPCAPGGCAPAADAAGPAGPPPPSVDFPPGAEVRTPRSSRCVADDLRGDPIWDSSAAVSDSEESEYGSLIVEPDPNSAKPPASIDGCRVVDLQGLLDQLKPVYQHSAKCTYGEMELVG